MFPMSKKMRVRLWQKKGQKLLSRGKLSQALAVFQKLSEIDKSADTFFHYGLVLLGLNQYDEAEKYFTFVQKEYPDNYLNLLSLAEVKLFQKKWDEAVLIYQKLTKLHPEKESFAQQLQIAQDVVLREKYIKSKELMNEAREALNKKQGYKAIEKLEKALEYNPKNAHLLNNIGSIYLLKKEYAKALENFEKALQLEPTNHQIQRNLAVAKRKLRT
jgi:tetratricopeptide (TPR) repeat protein